MHVTKLIDLFRTEASRTLTGQLLVQHLPNGWLLVSEGTVMVRGHEGDFGSLLHSFPPLDVQSGRLLSGGVVQDLGSKLEDLWNKYLEPDLLDLVDTGIEIDSWHDRMRLFQTQDGRYKFVDTRRADPFVRRSYTFRSASDEPTAPIWVFLRNEPVAMVLPVALGAPQPDAMNYIKTPGKPPEVICEFRMEPRLLREGRTLRLVEAKVIDGAVTGFSENQPPAGETVAEIRFRLNRVLDACYKPVLVERDGGLVEDDGRG